MSTTYYEDHPKMRRAIRSVVLKVDAGEQPSKDDDTGPATEFGYVVRDIDIAPEGEIPRDYYLTPKGLEAAARWRKDDSHGGNAA
jgi:hypothetical protein